MLQTIEARIAELTTARAVLVREFGGGGNGVVVVRTKRAGGQPTGTEALIVDVLTTERMKAKDIAKAIKVSPAATAKHLTRMVREGTVDVQGKSRATTYGLA